ncbi:MAG: hypothetical protein HKN79_08380 [Flavobacteriales bacterium]|nr:hypothetical protein [Flavobacteriales bacterium]
MANYDFIPGEEVSFLNEPGKAKVIRVQEDGNVLIETEEGFEMSYPASVLVPRFDLREERPEPEPIVQGPIMEMEGFSVGMRVHVLDQTETAMIIGFPDQGKAELEFEDLFVKTFPISQLVRTDTEQRKRIDESIEEVSLQDIGEDVKRRNPQKSLKQRKDHGVWEVDLHIQELIDNSHGMMKHEIVSLQLDHFDRKLNAAIERGLSKVIFIHGRGEGRLRNAIREILKRYPNCEFLDADYQRYGVGATEVRIKYRPRPEED